MSSIISDRKSLIEFLMQKSLTGGDVVSPALQCEFTVDVNYKNSTKQQEIVTAFSIPDSGLNFSLNSELLFFPTANIAVNQLALSFLVFPRSRNITSEMYSCFHKCYFAQYNNGLLKMPKDIVKPDITVNAKAWGDIIPLFTAKDCYFSYPIPSIDLKNANVSEYKVNISYVSFCFGGGK